MFDLKNAHAIITVAIALLLLAGCLGGGTPTETGNGGTGGEGNGGNGNSTDGSGNQTGGGTGATNGTGGANVGGGVEINDSTLDYVILMCNPGKYSYKISGCEGNITSSFEVSDIGFYDGGYMFLRETGNPDGSVYGEWLAQEDCQCRKTETVVYTEGKAIRIEGQCPAYERGSRERLADESVSVPAYSGKAAKYGEGDLERAYYWIAPGIMVPVKYVHVSEACTTTGELVESSTING